MLLKVDFKSGEPVYLQLISQVRLDTPLLFPAPGGGLLNLDNFRRREWAPAIEASSVRRPARNRPGRPR